MTNTNNTQFLRVHAYSRGKIPGILAEADRDPDSISHIEHPEPPTWLTGSRADIAASICEYMKVITTVKRKDGTIHKRSRRRDHRCLVAGTVSWPETVGTFYRNVDQKTRFQNWVKGTVAWLNQRFGKSLIGICAHQDEAFPHLHFFVVGDAQRIHPGMFAELVDNQRIEVPKERMAAHRLGLRSFLDDYFHKVGEPLGLKRSNGSKPAWRIADRRVRAKLFELDKEILRLNQPQLIDQRNGIWDIALKRHPPAMRF
jgi:hypothetical protein